MKSVIIVQNILSTVLTFRKVYISRLLSEGYTVVVLAPCDNKESRRRLVAMGCIVPELPLIKNIFLRSLLLNIALIKFRIKNFKNRHCIFVCHFISTYLLTYLSTLFLGKRLVLYVEGLGSLFATSKIRQWCLRRLVSLRSNNVLTCNNYEAKIIGVSKENITGGVGIELDKFASSTAFSKREILRIGYVGRLVADKGVFDAVTFFRYIINNYHSEAELHFIGDVYPKNPSSLSQKDIKEIKEEFQGKVFFHGYVDNPEEYYNNIDILVLFSKCEGFPVCVMEAAACSVPSVVYDVPGCRDAVINNITGIIVNKGEVKGAARKFMDYWNNESRFLKMKGACFNLSKENFDANVKAKQLVDYLEKCLKLNAD